MATLDQLNAALVKADAAGNSSDAKAFADEIRKMRNASPEAKKGTYQGYTPEEPPIMARVGRGMMDVGQGIKQLYLMGTDPEAAKKYTAEVNDEISLYEKGRGKDAGIDWARIGGNVAATAPAMLIPGAAAPALGARVASGAAGGAAAGGAMYSDEASWGQKAEQAALGAGMGGAVPAIASGAARVINPRAASNPEVQKLLNEGVSITPAQAMGGMAKTVEEKARSLPILGDAITAAHKRAGESLNAAVLNRGMAKLAPFTGGPSKVSGAGSEGLQELRIAAGNAYDNLLPKMSVNSSEGKFVNSIGNIRSMVDSMPAEEARQFDTIIKREFTERLAPNGVLSGQNLKQAMAGIKNKAEGFSKSTDYYQRDLGQSLKQVEAELMGLVERANPKYSNELSAVNEAYRIMKTAQKASSSLAAEDGVWTPSMLHSAVKAGDSTKNNRAFAEGTAYLQDLSSAGKNVLAQKYPDSGTAGRLALGGGALASGMASPAIPLSLIGASGAYLPKVQKALTTAVSRRPNGAIWLADSARKSSKYIAAPSAAAVSGPDK